MEKIYSNRIAHSYIQFLDKKFGKSVTDDILQKCKLDRLALADTSAFHSSEETEALTLTSIEVTGERDLPYLAGRNLADSLGKVGGFIAGVTSPNFFMRSLGQIESRLARKTITKTSSLGRNRYKVETTFKDGFVEPEFVCANRIGSYESAALFFGLPYAHVDHPECKNKGADHCVYYVQFPEYGFSVFNRIFQVLAVVSIVFGITWLTDMHSQWPLIATLICAAFGSMSFSLYRHFSAKRAMEWSRLTNEGLSKQNLVLENTNQNITSLQDLTTVLSNCVHIRDICEKVVETLVGRFHFGSSQLWLLDEKKEYLICKSALGYSESLKAFISNMRFKMGENWDNPYGLLVQTLEEKKTLLINNPEEVYSRVTVRTAEFLKALNISSFIITPLINEDMSLGILAAEFHHGEKIQNQDKLLFQSISNIVANALVKADLFEQMEAKILQRTNELEAAGRQLMAAKEMAIQSEKLSSLGQMAAGVAHEINNPLNFLVNIMPEVRRDMEGLGKIRDMAMIGAGLSPDLLAQIKVVDETFDLESHLSEKDYVFEKIKKALDKSTRIANSLKVFSRTSTKEKVEWESLLSMVGEVIELLPQKIKGDTEIQIDIPSELGWKVNKNEVEQAFLALVNNAIDAMEHKGKLEIKAAKRNGEAIMSFKDEGPGIPPEALKKIFDPFYTTKPPGKGTGLGLTIATEIVKKYGGSVSVESEAGKGSTFLIRYQLESTTTGIARGLGDGP